MFKTIVAQFDGSVCKRCNHPIAKGSQMRYGGRGRTYHLKADCETLATAEPTPAVPAADEGHAPDLDRLLEAEAEAWMRSNGN